MSDQEPEYALVFPTVVVKSAGGPYDDAAFGAGARFGALMARCSAGEDVVRSYESPHLLPQIDLMAMHYGYRFESEPWTEHPDEWAYIELTRIEEGA